jgi:hypothetical protein
MKMGPTTLVVATPTLLYLYFLIFFSRIFMDFFQYIKVFKIFIFFKIMLKLLF